MTAPTVDTYRAAIARRTEDLRKQADRLERQLAEAVDRRLPLDEVQRLALRRAEVLARMDVLADLYLDAEDRLLTAPEVARLLG